MPVSKLLLDESGVITSDAVWIGYYSKADGLDCIWLVNDEGEYEQTVDHEFLRKYFEIENVSSERSLYGKDRPAFSRIT